MTKQHFEVIASAIAEAADYLDRASWLDESEHRLARQIVWTVAEFVAQQLAKTNPNFSYVRFYRACKLN
jgi:hypothetical protein